MRSVPLQPCRRHGKKRKDDEPDAVIARQNKETSMQHMAVTQVRPPCSKSANPNSGQSDLGGVLDGIDAAQLQSSQVKKFT